MTGEVKPHDNGTFLKLTYSVKLLNALLLIGSFVFFVAVVMLIRIVGNIAATDTLSILFIGICSFLPMYFFYYYRFRMDTEAYKALIRKIVVRSSEEHTKF